MSADLSAGDLVERIKPVRDFDLPIGSICRVTAISPALGFCANCSPDDPHTAIWIAEVPTDAAWCLCGFRPVSRRSSFEATLEALRITAFDLAPQPRTTVPA